MTEPPVASVSDGRRKRWPIYVAIGGLLLLAAVATLSALGSAREPGQPAASAPTSFTLRGILELNGSLLIEGGRDTAQAGAFCAGTGGYDDIEGGASVTVTADGRIIALGQLESGVIKSATAGAFNKANGRCLFEFEVTNVPLGHDFYSVEISHRGEVNYPAALAQSAPISISLG